MDTEKANVYTDIVTADAALQAKQLDFSDEPIQSQSELACLQNGVGCPVGVNPADFSVTTAISEHGIFELQFDLSNNFWGCPMNFGNSACGINIRQAFAHLVDKSILATDVSGCAGRCLPIDNSVPPSLGLPTPNPCAWDPMFPQTSGPVGPCEVGPDPTTGQAGGVSYHLAPATSCGLTAGCGTNVPLHTWEPGLGTADFCAAASHLVVAGVATGKDPSTCILTGIGLGSLGDPKTHTVNIMTRNSNPRTELGNSIADEVCALFTGSFKAVGTNSLCPNVATTNSVLSGDIITQTIGAITAFPGFFTSSGSTINNDWWIYTGAFINLFPYDSLLYGVYNSIFASNNGPNAGTFGVGDVPPCSPLSVPTAGASDYMYNCQAAYDAASNAMEFAPCGSAIGDPTPGQITPTFATCPGTTNSTSVSAGYQVENIHGQTVVTLPMFGQRDQFAYLSNWARVINSVGVGIPQFFTWLNAYTATPTASGGLLQNCPTAPAIIGPDCMRQAFSQNTDGLNPYVSNTFWDANILGNVFDSLIGANPMNSNQLFGYMTTGFPTQLSNSQLGYTPAAGTTTSFRFTLRNDVFAHDGAPITSWDVKFDYVTVKAAGGPPSTGLVDMTDVHVLSPSTFDVNLKSSGPFTLFSIGSPYIFPARHWSSGGLPAWDAAVNACVSSTVPDSCFTTVDPSGMSSATGVTSPRFDPIKSGVLIGSGAFECLAVPGLADPSLATIGGGCSSTGLENPGVGGYYQLTNFGAGTTPGVAVPSSQYFRSSGKLAVYVWSGNNGQTTHDFLNSSTVASCFGKTGGACTQWTMGIGNSLGTSTAPKAVSFLTVTSATGFNGVKWTDPFNYLPGITYACCPFTASAPAGVAPLPMTLYEGTSNGNIGNPFTSGTEQVLKPAATAGCTSPYPTGGYDC